MLKRRNLTIKEDCIAKGDVNAGDIDVGKDAMIIGNIKASKLQIGKDCYISEDCECFEINVQGECRIVGNTKCTNIIADSLKCYKSLEATNIIVTKDFEAKDVKCWYLRVMGNIIAEKIDANGGPIYCGGKVFAEVVGASEVFEHFTEWENI